MKWDEYFMELARTVAKKSKDPSTKVGAVFVGADHEVLTVGFNGFPRGVDETNESRWTRPDKYSYVAHAEANGIYNAARHGVQLKDSTCYVTHLPCPDCAKAIIQIGCRHVIYTDKVISTTWDEVYKHTLHMFNESGVTLERFS